MANRSAPPLCIRPGDHATLRELIAQSPNSALARRARIIVGASEGHSNSSLARDLGMTRPTVLLWRRRYHERGVSGLHDDPRSGRPRSLDRTAILNATLAPVPDSYVVRRWSARLLAAHLGVSDSSITTTWRDFGLNPNPRGFVFATTPPLAGTVARVRGHFDGPGIRAIALQLCAAEPPQEVGDGVKVVVGPGLAGFLLSLERLTPSRRDGCTHIVTDRASVFAAWADGHPDDVVHTLGRSTAA